MREITHETRLQFISGSDDITAATRPGRPGTLIDECHGNCETFSLLQKKGRDTTTDLIKHIKLKAHSVYKIHYNNLTTAFTDLYTDNTIDPGLGTDSQQN